MHCSRLIPPSVSWADLLLLQIVDRRSARQQQPAREEIGRLVLLVVELERELVTGFNMEQFSGVVVRMGPPELVTPWLFDSARFHIRHSWTVSAVRGARRLLGGVVLLPRSMSGRPSWAALPKSVQDGVAGAALQDLMKVAIHSIESGAFSAHDESYLVWEPHTYDDLAFMAAVKILERTQQQLTDLEDEVLSRLAKTGKEGMLVAIALSGFEMGES